MWERWQGEAQTIDSFTIITTNANPLMQAVHERMPVIMLEDEFDRWLDSAHQDIAQLRGLLKPYTQDNLRIHPVSSAVNSPKQDSPELTRAMT